MRKLFTFLVLGLLFSGNAYANVQVLECKQIVEINDDIGEDLIIKRTVKINFDSKSINSYSPVSAENTSYEISNVTDVSIEAIRKPKLDNGMQSLSLNRYTLELKYHFYNENSVYQGASTFECNKLEKKI